MYFLSWFFHCIGSQWSLLLSMLQKTGMKKEEWASWPIVSSTCVGCSFLEKSYLKDLCHRMYNSRMRRKMPFCSFISGLLWFVYQNHFHLQAHICLLDQDDASCQLCCHKNSFDTSYICEITWEAEDGGIFFTITWRTEDGKENNSSLSEIHTASLYIYLIYLQKFLREASCITVI